jgi:hypothetical protein
MNWITIRATSAVNDKGSDMGKVAKGTKFTADNWTKTFNGGLYQRWMLNRWLPAADVAEDVPIVEPPPVEPPVSVIRQVRYSYDNMVTWTEPEYWEKVNV